MSNAVRAMGREPIYGLDLLRFAAAMLVTLYHFRFRLPESGDMMVAYLRTPKPLPVADTGWWFCWIGVQVFFVISGLVIAYSVEGTSRAQFVRSRVARLLPAMLICATVAGRWSFRWGR
jgi:peptidoglycan/LPS O-acetylase OafA/YrhL